MYSYVTGRDVIGGESCSHCRVYSPQAAHWGPSLGVAVRIGRGFQLLGPSECHSNRVTVSGPVMGSEWGPLLLPCCVELLGGCSTLPERVLPEAQCFVHTLVLAYPWEAEPHRLAPSLGHEVTYHSHLLLKNMSLRRKTLVYKYSPVKGSSFKGTCFPF